jgi:hypothetical protein
VLFPGTSKERNLVVLETFVRQASFPYQFWTPIHAYHVGILPDPIKTQLITLQYFSTTATKWSTMNKFCIAYGAVSGFKKHYRLQ